VTGLLVLLLAIFLLVSFFSGRLEWLFELGQDVGDARRNSEPSPPFGPSGAAPTTAGSGGAGGGF